MGDKLLNPSEKIGSTVNKKNLMRGRSRFVSFFQALSVCNVVALSANVRHASETQQVQLQTNLRGTSFAARQVMHGTLFSSMSIALLIVGCENPEEDPPPDPRPVRYATEALHRSFEVTALLESTATGDPAPPTPPEEHVFVIRFDDNDAGRVSTGITAVGTLVTERSFTIAEHNRNLDGELFVPLDATCLREILQYESLEVALYDDDGDGDADTIGGTASGTYVVLDAGGRSVTPFQASITGVVDVDPPTYAIVQPIAGPRPDVLHILEPIVVLASEAVSPDTEGRLDIADGIVELHGLPDDQPAIASFARIEGRPLPFGTPLEPGFAPRLVDLNGNAAPLPPSWTFITLDDPGVVDSIDFETEPVHAALTGNVGLTVLQSISGVRSLVLETNSNATFHLRIEPGDTVLRLSVGVVGAEIAEATIRVGSWSSSEVTGAGPIAVEPQDPPPVPGELPSDEIEIDLPNGATERLVVSISFPATDCMGTSGRTGVLVVDDIRVE